MGGMLSVTVRKEDGEVIKMERSTNTLPYYIRNAKMFDKVPEHVDAYIKQCFPENMNFVLVPSGYGLVVVDLLNNVILDNQGYSRLNKFNMPEVYLEIPFSGDYVITDDHISVHLLKELYDSNRIVSFSRFNLIEEFVENIPFKKDEWLFDDLLLSGRDDSKYIRQLFIDTSPVTYEYFEENSKGFSEMYKRVKELGFILTDEEESDWEKYINNLRHDEEEE